MRDFNLSPRDVALYERSNDYLTRMNALDPYSREYANVYNDYVDTIDQLSNRDFRASLGPTLLEFAPMTRPKAQPKAPEPKVTPYGITVSSPDWRAYPYTTAESQPRAANQQKGLSSMVADSVEPTAQGLALMQQAAPSPEPVQLAPANNILYRREFDPVPVTPRMAPSYEFKSPPIKLAKMYEANIKKLRAAPEPTQEVTPMMMEGSLPLVEYPNNTTLSPFVHSSPYAEALSRLSWPGQVIPITNDWY